MYDAEIGRFLGVDPLAREFQAYSSYNYVLGNPVRLVDPDGRSADDIILKGVNDSSVRIVTGNDEETTVHVPLDLQGKHSVDISEYLTEGGNGKVLDSDLAIGYSLSLGAEYGIGAGLAGGISVSNVMFLGGEHKNYWHAYSGNEGSFHAMAGIGAIVKANASITVGYNKSGNRDPNAFAGESTITGIEVDATALIGKGDIGVTISNSPDWITASIGISLGAGPILSAGTINRGIANSTLLTTPVPTSERSFIDRATNILSYGLTNAVVAPLSNNR